MLHDVGDACDASNVNRKEFNYVLVRPRERRLTIRPVLYPSCTWEIWLLLYMMTNMGFPARPAWVTREGLERGSRRLTGLVSPAFTWRGSDGHGTYPGLVRV
jgi:hypothetical protein